ncbi:hypothetical protein CAL7716_106370 (plasmid) [Calothrix sp. PCC 7716]|nr:hypothetical protein CAL7716_106370 [Calothrix sp. PCC 7716]
MVFNELKTAVTSVKNTINSLIDEVIDLKSQIINISFVNKSEGLRILSRLQNMVKQISTCQSKAEVVTQRINAMQNRIQFISSNEANELEADKVLITQDFRTLLNNYDTTYSELVRKNLWANLQDTWQQFKNGVNDVAGKVIYWSFTNIARPLLNGKRSSINDKLLPSSNPWWKSIF